jgi:hypothetical protein
MQPTATAIGEALSEQGARVLSPERAAVLFEQEDSAPPPTVTDEQIDRLDALTIEALQLIVTQQYARALRSLRAAQRLAGEGIIELNRTEERARRVLDACLYMVRALYETGERAEAVEQARRCVRLVPGGEADLLTHPPEVVELHDELSRPGPDKTGSLIVNSTPEGCDVRVNGLLLGQTPFTLTDLYPGDYQVQVECDPAQRGRVRTVSVGTTKTALVVDAQLDGVVHTKPLLRTQYSTEPEAELELRDARAIASVLGVDTVVIASSPSANVLELQAIEATGSERVRLVRLTNTPSGPSGDDAAAAAVALLSGDCRDLTGKRPVTLPCPGEWSGSLRPPKGQWVSGLTLLGVGGASLLASYGLAIWRRDTGDVVVEQIATNPDDTTNQSKWLNQRTGIVLTAATGGALTTAAMPLFLPYRSKTPWWGWLSGGLGVGLAVGSIVSVVTAEPAPDGNSSCSTEFVTVDKAQACVNRGRAADRAIVLGATAAPLLTIPLVYLLRRDAKKPGVHVTPSISLGRESGSISFRGRF